MAGAMPIPGLPDAELSRSTSIRRVPVRSCRQAGHLRYTLSVEPLIASRTAGACAAFRRQRLGAPRHRGSSLRRGQRGISSVTSGGILDINLFPAAARAEPRLVRGKVRFRSMERYVAEHPDLLFTIALRIAIRPGYPPRWNTGVLVDGGVGGWIGSGTSERCAWHAGSAPACRLHDRPGAKPEPVMACADRTAAAIRALEIPQACVGDCSSAASYARVASPSLAAFLGTGSSAAYCAAGQPQPARCRGFQTAARRCTLRRRAPAPRRSGAGLPGDVDPRRVPRRRTPGRAPRRPAARFVAPRVERLLTWARSSDLPR